MSDVKIYPKEPYIGVDCSGQPKSPPMIAVATRYSRRRVQNKWIVLIKSDQIGKYVRGRDWEEKVYASLIFKAIDRIFQPDYEICVDKDFQSLKRRRKVISYLKYLFGCFHSGDPLKENPKVSFRTKHNQYVYDAHRKHGLARKGLIRINERTGIDHLMKLLG